MKKIVCDLCKKELNVLDCYDENGYSQYVNVEIRNSRKHGAEYDLCNNCYEDLFQYAARRAVFLNSEDEETQMTDFIARQGWQCPICKRVYSPDTPYGYSQYVNVEIRNSRKHGAEYDLCNNCYEDLFQYAARRAVFLNSEDEEDPK